MTESNGDDPSSKTWLGRVRWLISKPQFDWAMGSWIEGKGNHSLRQPWNSPLLGAATILTPCAKKRATPHVKSTDDCIALAASTNRSTHAITLNHMFRISCRFFSRLQNDAFCNFLTGTDAALKHSKVYTKHRCTSHANAKSAGITAQRVGRCWKHYACFQTDRPHPATPFDISPIPRLPPQDQIIAIYCTCHKILNVPINHKSYSQLFATGSYLKT